MKTNFVIVGAEAVKLEPPLPPSDGYGCHHYSYGCLIKALL